MKELVLIPSYKPDERLLDFLGQLKELGVEDVLIVDDGSEEKYHEIYTKATKEFPNCEVIYHAVNLGKGRALKTGMNHALNKYPDMVGVVACDADGQHPAHTVQKAAKAMHEHPDKLILGTRRFFKGKNVPFSNFLGNQITIFVFKLLTGLYFGDTQCGLRAFPNKVMRKLIKSQGDGFEYENIMLIDLRREKIGYAEIPMDAIYFEEDVHTSHFNKIKDSFIIYKNILKFAVFPIFAGIVGYLATLLFFEIAPLCSLIKTAFIYALGLLLGWLILFIPVSEEKGKWHTILLPVLHTAVFSAAFYWLLNYKAFSVSAAWWLTAILAGPVGYGIYLRLRYGKKPDRVKIKGE